MLGALIQCEAGSGSYEGMVAVGAVVMNRVRSGSYPGSISGVIYQGGQFPPALNGSVARVIANGVRSACLQAASEAIGGTDNTNGALSFRSAASGYGLDETLRFLFCNSNVHSAVDFLIVKQKMG